MSRGRGPRGEPPLPEGAPEGANVVYALGALSREYGFAVIEDASHAIGGGYQGKPIGACAHSEMTVFSFHPVKIVTTGEGGMVVTNSAELHARLGRLRSHGITRDPSVMESASEGPWYYQQVELGYNFRMTDIQAALGASQMTRLPEFIERRHALAARYDRLLAGLPLRLPHRDVDGRSALHLYPVQVLPGAGMGRREVFEGLRARGIGVNVHYIPVHTQPHYLRLGFRPGQFPEAEAYYSRAISLPMFHGLTDADQDKVIAAVKELV